MARNIVLRVSTLFRLYFFAGLLVVSGALQRLVGGYSIEGRFLDFEAVQNRNMMWIGAAFYGLTLLLFLSRATRLRLPRLVLFPVFLCVLAVASGLWSAHPGIVLNRSIGLVGCTLFALTVGSVFSAIEIGRMLLMFFAVFVVLNLLIVIIAPGYTFHSSSEFYSVHAGLLKGTYFHKNAMALILGVALISFVTLGRGFIDRWWVILLSGAAALMLMLAGSAKSFVSVPFAVMLGTVMARLKPNGRFLLMVFGLTAGVFLLGSGVAETLSDITLSRLGRDPTLSARTLIWSAAIEGGIQGNLLLGGGYGGAAWAGGIGAAVSAAIGSNPGHSHSGFIQVFIELGLVGLGLFVGYMLVLIKALITSPVSVRGSPIYGFCVAYMMFYLISNSVATAAMETSSIYWFLVTLIPYLIRGEERFGSR